jgi:hypothetical protein
MLNPFSHKGWQPRTEREQVALAVRIYENRHHSDLEQRAQTMLGERRGIVGPVDVTRNALRAQVDRVNRAYLRPPACSGISEALLAACDDASATTLIRRYGQIGALPLPSTLQTAARDALGYRLAAGYSAVMVGWASRRRRVTFTPISPADIACEYAGDDPTVPTVIVHHRQRWDGDRFVQTREIYDLTDEDKPVYKVERIDDDKDITPDDTKQWPKEWIDAAGRPHHRIVVLGQPGQPYATAALVEAALRFPIMWSHWGAAIIDAGHPFRYAIGATPRGAGSDERSGQVGAPGGPEAIHIFDNADPERPGLVGQLGPGYDPKITGEAIAAAELAASLSLGLPLPMSSVGGEPTVAEEEAAERAAALHYPALRRWNAAILSVAESYAAVAEQRRPIALSIGVLYGDEVEAALEAFDLAQAAKAAAAPPADSEDTPDA